MAADSIAPRESSGREAEVADFLERHPDTRFIEAFTPDLTGYGFGKRLPVGDLDTLYRKGIGFSAAPFVLDTRHLGYGSGGLGWDDGDPDATGRPRPGTLKPMPWASHPTAQVMLDLSLSATGELLWSDPRLVLSGVVDRLAADGFFPHVACELELYLIDGRRDEAGRIRPPTIGRTGRPLGYPTNLAVSALEDVSDWCAAIADAAAVQDVPVGAVVAEMGVGQFEINLAHQKDPLLAGDHAVLLKRLVRGVSRARGWDATFMAKPYREDAGSGLHVHVSLAGRDGCNLFAGDDGEALIRHAVAGLYALLPDSLAFLAPNRNSYRRFGGLFAPVNRKWGEDNRTVAFRIPTERGHGRRIEHRVAGADANPYLAVASILAGMHYGIVRKLTPQPPVTGKHAGRKADPALPGDVFAAARRLGGSRALRDYIPARYLDTYAHHIHHQHEEFLSEMAVREYEFFL